MREDLKKYYEHLEKARLENDFIGMLAVLTIITKYTLYKTDFVFQCLYMLIKKGYYKEVEELLNHFIVLNRNQFQISLLRNAIANQENFESLEEEKKNVYYQAILEGHIYYKESDLCTAYDIYSWGYYMTNQPIFLYYIGKMLFKNRNFKDARIYFEEYLKNGDQKVSKACLYMFAILKKKHQYSLAKKYQNYATIANKIYNNEFEMSEIYIKGSDEDILKIKLQNKHLYDTQNTQKKLF